MPDYRSLARQIARQRGIDPNYFFNQIQAESNFDPTARSSAGAFGIAQIVPRWNPGVDPWDPVAALKYAANLDATLLKKYGGDWRQVLSVYNSGKPDKWSDPGFSSGQTYNYVRKILGADYVPGTAGVPSTTTSSTTPSTPSSAPPSGLPTGTPPSLLPPKIPGLDQPGFATVNPLSLVGKSGSALTNAFLKQSLRSSDAAMRIVSQSFKPLELPDTTPTTSTTPGSTPTTTSEAPPSGEPPATTHPPSKWKGSVLGTTWTWGSSPAGHTAAANAAGRYQNWESKNAWDLYVPYGTPIYAVEDGTIGSQFGPLDSSDPKLAGLRLHLATKGNEFYYAHMSEFAPGIKPGVHVQKGQLLGYSGAANGVNHLHLGSEYGNPASFIGQNPTE